MANLLQRLLQEIINGKYSKDELKEIIQQAEYTIKVYEETEKRIDQAQQDDEKNKKLKEIDEKINNLQAKRSKMFGRQKIFLTISFALLLPLIISLIVLGTLGSGDVIPTVGASAMVYYTAAIVPIVIINKKDINIRKEISELKAERAKLLSTACYTISPEVSSRVYGDVVTKNNTQIIENSNDDTIDID